jgi:hypothetical protein
MLTVKAFDKTGKRVNERKIPQTQKVLQTRQRRKLSPDFDPNKLYIPRSARPEWNVVGLLGVVKIIKGSPVNANWTKIQEQDNTYDLWLIK